uniref:Uncharacterized protein n=1 Tax=Anguilla anguilla TaxID=7936 RepID=A0A0E9RPP3_ANGAN
MTDRGHFW